eukprot:1123365-Pyramimonas_sp.AAC.1
MDPHLFPPLLHLDLILFLVLDLILVSLLVVGVLLPDPASPSTTLLQRIARPCALRFLQAMAIRTIHAHWRREE